MSTPSERIREAIQRPSTEFLQHAVIAKSQYDESYRATAAHILALRGALSLAVEALAKHRAFGIYGECGHDHKEDEPGVVVVEELDKPYTCEDGLVYTVCEACDTDGGLVREDSHLGEWPCQDALVLQAIADLLAPEPGGEK